MNRKYGVWLILLIVSINILFGLGGAPLMDPDEPVYAETAREMIEFGDYLSPRIYNEFWYDKPPMYYWLVAGTMQVFGVNEFSARFPSALLGISTVLVLYFGIRKIFDEDTAFWSSLILGTCVEFFYLGKAAVTDMTLLFFMTSAILAFLNKKYWLFYICMALATVTKGPIGLVFPSTIVFLYLLISGEWHILKKMHIPFGVVLYLLIASPWYYLMFQAHGKEFIDTFFGFHNITRFTTPEHPTRVTWWYYLPVVILGLFPWTGLLISAIKASICDSSTDDMKKLTFMHVWWVFVFIFFTITKTKLVSYIFPMFPALAIIIGWHIAQLSHDKAFHRHFGIAASSVVMFLLLAVGWIIGGKQLPEMVFGGLVLACITVILAIGIFIAFTQFRDVVLAAWLHVTAGVLTMLVIFTFMLPTIENKFSVREAVTYFKSNCDTRVTTHVDKFLRPGFMFYSQEPGVEIKPGSTDFKDLLTTKESKYIIIRGLEYRRLKNTETSMLKQIYNANDIYIFKLN